MQRIVIAVGLPGSGKSTYLASIGANAISSDAIRLLLADDATIQTIHGQVFATMRYLLRRRMLLTGPRVRIRFSQRRSSRWLPFRSMWTPRRMRMSGGF